MQKNTRFLRFMLLVTLCLGTTFPGLGQDSELSSPLSLSQAIGAVLSKHPELAATRARSEAARWEHEQAGRLPNPTLRIEWENFGGSGPFAGTKTLENSFAVGQEILTGGKRRHRRTVSGAKTAEEHITGEVTALNLSQVVTDRYLECLKYQRLIDIEEENLRLVSGNLAAVKRKLDAGDIPEADFLKAEVETATIRAGQESLHRTFQAHLRQLTTLCGLATATLPRFSDQSLPAAAPALDQYASASEAILASTSADLRRHPEYLLAEARRRMHQAELGLTRANASPDLEVEAGVKRERQTGKHGYFAGISVPVQIFDRHRGSIQASRSLLNAAESTAESVLLELESRRIEFAGRIEAAERELTAMDETVLPGATKAYEMMERAYTAGERDYLELIDARRTLLSARRTRVHLEFEHLHATARLHFLLGRGKPFVEAFSLEERRTP